jgi:hypothetical protein
MAPLRARERTATTLLLSAAAALAAVNALFFFPRLVDDAFITLRYAEQLLAGHGLVYNRGEWVEGYSSLTWVLVQAGGIALGLDGITATKLAAALATVGLLVGVYRMAREAAELAPPWAAAATALVAANAYVISWCFYGLETPLYLALLVWFGVLARRVDALPFVTSRALSLGAVGIALALTRPEAPLMLLAMGLGVVRFPEGPGALRGTLRRFAPSAVIVVVGYGAFLLTRRALYGHLVPHTFFAKRGEGFAFSHLASLFSEGAPLVEQIFWVASAAASVAVFLVTRRLLVPAVVLANFFFVAQVELDWMPNARHLLPSWIVASIGVAGLAHPRVRRHAPRAGVVALSALIVSLGLWLVSVDSRFSRYEYRTHGGGVNWVRPKTLPEWRSALALLRREDPPGFEEANPDRLGLIDLTFLAVEASSRPEEETWFLGRDIGMVGYFSPIGVYENVGLFTPSAIAWTGGDERAPVPDEAISQVFERDIVAGEIYGVWSEALGRHPGIVRRYRVLAGSLRHPVRFVQRADPRPSAEELEARYQRVRAKMPRLFHFSELYGSPAGPAIELRARVATARAR